MFSFVWGDGMRVIRLGMLLCSVVLLISSSFAQHDHAGAAKPAVLMQGFGDVHHPVTTSNPEAQKFFEQGLALSYGFNHDEAERSFRKAAELDPKMAMAWWGVAYVAGPNYNQPVDPEHEKRAFDAIQKAISLEENASKAERDYINALAKRYSDQPNPNYQKLAADYNAAMRELSHNYPDDLDAATIFAESGMNLRPWKLWTRDGSPEPGTEEIVATLESVIRRDPDHIGACHFYIHAVEASRDPQRASECAHKLAGLAPSSGHLVHMPAHIFIRTGDHLNSAKTNELAAKADEKYIEKTQVQGVYPMMYYTHNLHFLAIERATMGQYAEAMEAANKVHEHVTPVVPMMVMVDFFAPLPTLVMVRFHRWDDVLKVPAPGDGQPVSIGVYHFARGMALASQGKVEEARKELAALKQASAKMAVVESNPSGPGNAQKIPQIMAHLVEARIALALKDHQAAVKSLREAASIEDTMDYNEPPDWFIPVRESLGATLLASGEAADAEQVFRKDLEWNIRNPRSLFGLMEALKAQKKDHDAQWVQREFESVWKGDKLSLSDL